MEDPTTFLNRLGKFVLIPIGLLLFVAAAWSIWSTNSWLARTLEVEGVVVEMVRMRDSDDKGYVFSPLVRFETADGGTHEFQSGLRTYPPAYRTGEVVSVVYDPAVPDAAMIRSLLSLWLMPIILSFIGTIFCAIGIFMIVMCSWHRGFSTGRWLPSADPRQKRVQPSAGPLHDRTPADCASARVAAGLRHDFPAAARAFAAHP